MIWGETTEAYVKREYSWRPWFAWRPVRLIDGRRAWRCMVERRHKKMTVLDLYYPPLTVHEYRLPETL